MLLDIRSNCLLKEVIKNPNISSNELAQKFNLSKRQINYSFSKINDWLYEQNFPQIERTNHGYFVVDPSLLKVLSEKENTQSVDFYDLSKLQRVHFIILMILTRMDALSLAHFTSELKVSKNTVIDDLKKVKDIVEQHGLEYKYSRKYGYVIEGDEFQCRKLLISITNSIWTADQGKEKIIQISQLSVDELEEFKNRLEKVEASLNLKFTDEKLELMPYILIFILRRIRKGHHIGSFNLNYNEISGTKEYLATEELLHDFPNVSEEERLFITLNLLTTNVYWSKEEIDKEIPELKSALSQVIDNFEKNTFIFLKDKEQLLQKLVLHMKPAYFRIKYNLTDTNDVLDDINKNFKELHHLVKKSVKPLEDLIGSAIPESEIAYLTILIGGWLSRQGDNISQRMKAIVVCPKGISVSRLMYGTLRELFPEFIFLDSLSVREFQQYEMDYDIVFSPVYLKTNKKFFLVDHFIGAEEKRRLRKEVMSDLYGFVPEVINVEELMGIIEKHAVIKNKKELYNAIQSYIHQDSNNKLEKHSIKNPNLCDLITPSTMIFRHSVRSWEEAIKLAAQPLLKDKSIKEQYVEAMIKHCQSDPYFVISEHVAIPHASPDEGVNRLSMSLLKLRKGVAFENYQSIKLIIVIAALDKDQHLKAFMQLMNLVRNEQDLNKVLNAQSMKDLHEVLKLYAQE